jgi:pilus assembly protein CpaC
MGIVALALLLVTVSAVRSEESGPKTATQPSAETVTQPMAEAEAGIQATIRQAEELAQRVMVPLGGNTVVDLNTPLVRTSVAQPDIAEVQLISPRQVVVTGKTVGSTVMVLADEHGDQLELNLVVEPQELAQIRAAIAAVSGDAEVNVRIVRETIVLSGEVGDIDTIDNIVQIATIFAGEANVRNQLTLAGSQQVLLRCTVAEVSKQASRELGVNGWLAGDNVRDMFAMSQINAINPFIDGGVGMAPTGDIIQPGGLDFSTAAVSPAIPIVPTPAGPELSIGFPRIQMQLFLRALRDNTLLRVLAEPNLVAINGQEATFLAGGEFPVPIPQGLGTTTIEWREYGVRLRFTPTVIGRQMVRLSVRPEISERDFTTAVALEGGTIVPGLTSRSADTTVELACGSTLAIGGLLNETARGLARSMPGLGDLPVLGALFRSVEFQQARSELVILVTPEMVESLNPDQVSPVPGQFMTEPSDYQLFGLGMLEGDPSSNESIADDAVNTKTPPRYRKYTSPPEQMTLHGLWGPAEAVESVQ